MTGCVREGCTNKTNEAGSVCVICRLKDRRREKKRFIEGAAPAATPEKKAAEPPRHVTKEKRRCNDCGEMFQPTGNRQFRCPVCGPAGQRKAGTERKRRARARKAAPAKPQAREGDIVDRMVADMNEHVRLAEGLYQTLRRLAEYDPTVAERIPDSVTIGGEA